jgi:hypothetical protein
MGRLTIISETGFPHSACLFEYGESKSWMGFKPKIPKLPVFTGYVDKSDRSKSIKNFACFSVPDVVIEKALLSLESKYTDLLYIIVFGIDCNDFTLDTAKLCGLAVPTTKDIFPNHLVLRLAKLNTHILLDTSLSNYIKNSSV